MRLLPAALLVLTVVAGCGDDDDEPRAAATTITTTVAESCDGDLEPLVAADGTPAEVVATAGDVTLAVTDRGASVEVVGLFTVERCAYEPLQLDGATATLAVGGSVTHGNGLRCDGDAITVLAASSDDGETYQATATTYEVEGTELVEVKREASTIEAQADASALDPYYRLDC